MCLNRRNRMLNRNFMRFNVKKRSFILGNYIDESDNYEYVKWLWVKIRVVEIG